MLKRIVLLLLGVLMAYVPQAALAGDTEQKPFLDLSGFYAFDAYSQNNFFLGRSGQAVEDAEAVGQTPTVGGVSDKDNYAVQLFRIHMEFGYENVHAVVRGDLAQSIWGIDNSQRDTDRPGFSNIFNNKDTGFETHWDWAYIDATHPEYGLNAKLGRQKVALGNLLILDQDGDAIIVSKKFDDSGSLILGWSKMSEGVDGLSDEDAEFAGSDVRDATLYLAQYKAMVRGWLINPFLAYYNDNGDGDMTSYIPNGFQYMKARFTPNISSATAFGLNVKGKKGLVAVKGEIDFLTGTDDISNTSSGPAQVLDVNDGDLSGFNLYVDAKVDAGPNNFKVGGVIGIGSGDDDPMDGDGNINKIRTNGFFYVNEIWEDSVMPDELGITPQGLGSPASRGYREFENTTLVQLNASVDVHPKVNAFISGTWMKATEEIYAWASATDADGNVTAASLAGVDSADDLGFEVDGKVTWKMSKGLLWIFRGGAFFPGDAAGYLVNGTADYDDTAWEARTTVKFGFDGVRIGG